MKLTHVLFVLALVVLYIVFAQMIPDTIFNWLYTVVIFAIVYGGLGMALRDSYHKKQNG